MRLLRKAYGIASRQATLRLVSMKHCSKDIISVNKAENKVLNALNAEIQEEEAEVSKDQILDESIETYLVDNNWTFDISPSSTQFSLEKKIEGTTIRVISNIRSQGAEDEVENSEEEQSQEDDDGYDNNSSESYADFLVLIEKEGRGKVLVVDMLTISGELQVNNFFLTDDVGAVLSNRFNYSQKDYYSGPQFDSLDEKVTTSFNGYLKTLGIDSDLGQFLESNCIELENRYYRSWLNDLRLFIE